MDRDVNKLIAQREQFLAEADRVSEGYGLELEGLDMMSVDALDDLLAVLRKVRDATARLDYEEGYR